MIELNYNLKVQIEGAREIECLEGLKGAGEARKEFERLIRAARFSASSTSIRTTGLIENEQ